MAGLLRSHDNQLKTGRPINRSAIETYLFKKRNRNHQNDASENNTKSSKVQSTKYSQEPPLDATDILHLHPSMAEKMLLIFANYIREKDRCEDNITDKSGENDVNSSVISHLLTLCPGGSDDADIKESCSLSDEDKIAILARRCRTATGTTMGHTYTERSKIPKKDENSCIRRLISSSSRTGQANTQESRCLIGLSSVDRSSVRNLKESNMISCHNVPASTGNLNTGNRSRPPNYGRGHLKSFDTKSSRPSICNRIETDLNGQNNDAVTHPQCKHVGKPIQTFVAQNKKKQRLQYERNVCPKMRDENNSIRKPNKQGTTLIKHDVFKRTHDTKRMAIKRSLQNPLQKQSSKHTSKKVDRSGAELSHFCRFLCEKNQNKTISEKHQSHPTIKKSHVKRPPGGKAYVYKNISNQTKTPVGNKCNKCIESTSTNMKTAKHISPAITFSDGSSAVYLPSANGTGDSCSTCCKSNVNSTCSRISTTSAIISNSSNSLYERNTNSVASANSTSNVISERYGSNKENGANIYSECHINPSGSQYWPTHGSDESNISNESSKLTRIDDILTSLSENIGEFSRNDADFNSRDYDNAVVNEGHVPFTCLYVGDGNNRNHRNENGSRRVCSVGDSACHNKERNASRREITPPTRVVYDNENKANRLTYSTTRHKPPRVIHESYNGRFYPYSLKHHSTRKHDSALGLSHSLKTYEVEELSNLSYSSRSSLQERVGTNQSAKYSPVNEDYDSCFSSSSGADGSLNSTREYQRLLFSEKKHNAELFSSSKSDAHTSNTDMNQQLFGQLMTQRPMTNKGLTLQHLYKDARIWGFPMFTSRRALVAYISYVVPDLKRILVTMSLVFTLFFMLPFLK